jgi:hypothetical protein
MIVVHRFGLFAEQFRRAVGRALGQMVSVDESIHTSRQRSEGKRTIDSIERRTTIDKGEMVALVGLRSPCGPIYLCGTRDGCAAHA